MTLNPEGVSAVYDADSTTVVPAIASFPSRSVAVGSSTETT